MSRSPEAISFGVGPLRWRDTWAALPSEAAKRPGVVTVTDAAGQVIATIDPSTRRRVGAATGRTEAVLAPQGFNTLPGWRGIAIAPPRPRDHPDYEPSRAGMRRERDARR